MQFTAPVRHAVAVCVGEDGRSDLHVAQMTVSSLHMGRQIIPGFDAMSQIL